MSHFIKPISNGADKLLETNQFFKTEKAKVTSSIKILEKITAEY